MSLRIEDRHGTAITAWPEDNGDGWVVDVEQGEEAIGPMLRHITPEQFIEFTAAMSRWS